MGKTDFGYAEFRINFRVELTSSTESLRSARSGGGRQQGAADLMGLEPEGVDRGVDYTVAHFCGKPGED